MIYSGRPALIGGALRGRHERGVRDAVDAMHRKTTDGVADGEIVWSWPPDAEVKRAGVTNAARDGGKKARSPGRSRISRNTIAQGMPDDFG